MSIINRYKVGACPIGIGLLCYRYFCRISECMKYRLDREDVLVTRTGGQRGRTQRGRIIATPLSLPSMVGGGSGGGEREGCCCCPPCSPCSPCSSCSSYLPSTLPPSLGVLACDLHEPGYHTESTLGLNRIIGRPRRSFVLRRRGAQCSGVKCSVFRCQCEEYHIVSVHVSLH